MKSVDFSHILSQQKNLLDNRNYLAIWMQANNNVFAAEMVLGFVGAAAYE